MNQVQIFEYYGVTDIAEALQSEVETIIRNGYEIIDVKLSSVCLEDTLVVFAIVIFK
jgi:hypothetical protein